MLSSVPDGFALVHVGDLGEGFSQQHVEETYLREIAEYLETRNAKLYVCRGNHADPSFYKPGHWSAKFQPTITFVPDYTVLDINGLSHQFVGGAISIDRSDRTMNVRWWEDEPVQDFIEERKPVDVLVTHSAPSFCEPTQFSNIVYNWACRELTLLQELKDERKLLNCIFRQEPVKYLHVYGHFHASYNMTINGVIHKGLAINELWELT
jgi:predicted phosphodiesterase